MAEARGHILPFGIDPELRNKYFSTTGEEGPWHELDIGPETVGELKASFTLLTYAEGKKSGVYEADQFYAEIKDPVVDERILEEKENMPGPVRLKLLDFSVNRGVEALPSFVDSVIGSNTNSLEYERQEELGEQAMFTRRRRIASRVWALGWSLSAASLALVSSFEDSSTKEGAAGYTGVVSFTTGLLSLVYAIISNSGVREHRDKALTLHYASQRLDEIRLQLRQNGLTIEDSDGNLTTYSLSGKEGVSSATEDTLQ